MNPNAMLQQTVFSIQRSKYFTLLRLQVTSIGFLLSFLSITNSLSIWSLCGTACVLILALQLQAWLEAAMVSIDAWTRRPFPHPWLLAFVRLLICCFSTICLLPLLTNFDERTFILAVFLGTIWTTAWNRKRDLFGRKFLGVSVSIPYVNWYEATRRHVRLVIKAMNGMGWVSVAMFALLVAFLAVMPSWFPNQISTWIRLGYLFAILTAFWISGLLIFDHVLNSCFDFGNPQEFDHFPKIIAALRSENQIMMRYGFAQLKWLSLLGGGIGRDYRKALYSRNLIPTIWDVCVEHCRIEIDKMNYVIVQISERIPDYQSFASSTSSVKAREVAQKITHKQVILSHCLNALTGFSNAACTEDIKGAAKNGDPPLGTAITVIFEGFHFVSLFYNGNLQSLGSFENIKVLLEDFEMSCSSLWYSFRQNLFVQMTKPHYMPEAALKRSIELMFRE